MPGRYEVYRSSTLVVDFQLNRRGIARCAVGKELKAAVQAIAADAKVYAVTIAPRSARTDRRPHYADSFQVRGGHVTLPKRWPMRRVAAFLGNTAAHAAHVEFGDGSTPEYRVLRRTLEHLASTAATRTP